MPNVKISLLSGLCLLHKKIDAVIEDDMMDPWNEALDWPKSGFIVFPKSYVDTNPNLTIYHKYQHYWKGYSKLMVYSPWTDGQKHILDPGDNYYRRNKPDWRNSHPQSTPIAWTLRHKYCKRMHNTTLLADKYNQPDGRKQGDCRDWMTKFGMRRYGCNCYPDLYDGLGTGFDEGFIGWRGRQLGVKTINMGNTGDPVDWLDALCQKTYFRTQCLIQDLEAGHYDRVAPIDKLYDNGPIHGMTYIERVNWCDQMNTSYVTPYNETEGITQEDLDRTEFLDAVNKLGWQDQCGKRKKNECGHLLHYPYFIDEDGEHHCGWPENPDYIHGTPEGEECQRDMCFIHSQFADEVLDGLEAHGYGKPVYTPETGEKTGLWKFFEDNRHNYFTYQKHINVTNGQGLAKERTDGGGEQNYDPWLVEWDMNLDAAGNRPQYFPDTYPWPPEYLPEHTFSKQVGSMVHFNQPYSIAPEKCFHKPRFFAETPLPKQCCGQQPHRYPYQPAHKECCNGAVKDFGTCG